MSDQLDQMLDQAIKSYAAVEPPPELPVRILRQAQQEPAPLRNHWRLALAIALPLAAALAIAFAGRMTLPTVPAPIASQPSIPSIAAPMPPQPPETLAAATHKPAVPVPVRRHVHSARASSSWARPLPAPYSKEELALLIFVQQHPKEAAEIAEAQKRDTQPITISHLEIKPLTIAPLK